MISLLPSCSSGAANFPQAIVIKMNFPAKTGQFSLFPACYQGVSGSIRENQGAKPLSNPGLILPSSLPSKLGWSPGDLRCVDAVAPAERDWLRQRFRLFVGGSAIVRPSGSSGANEFDEAGTSRRLG